ncbi:PPE family protein, partial [Mycobacterium gordonae]
AAWQGLATDLGSCAVAFSALTAGLTGSSWQGAASVAMLDAVAPYSGWLRGAAVAAEQAASQARLAAGAFEAARAATVHPDIISTNRAAFTRLVAANLLGLNAPAIAAVEAEYEQMWAQDVSALFAYHAEASTIAAALNPFGSTQFGRAQAEADPRFANLGFANLGHGNVGRANIGNFNIGSANIGSANFGSGNLGDRNRGVASIGVDNFGLGNLGDRNAGPGNAGTGNRGFWNTGKANLGIANSGDSNVGIANAGSSNIGVGLTGSGEIGFGALNSGNANLGVLNSGTGNIGLFNSGTGNIGIGNSGAGNWGIGNPGAGNTGIGNTGSYNTGFFNAGNINTGLGNTGGYNTGFFNAGSTNTGSYNTGGFNTGGLNSGSYNTGYYNAGSVNTGAFNRGNYNNGLFVTGNNQGQISAQVAIDIPTIPIDIASRNPLNQTMVVGGQEWTIPGYTYPKTYFLNGAFYLGPVEIATSYLTAPTVTVVIGSPATSIDVTVVGALQGGTIEILNIPAAPGFGNTSTTPSSGFFNSGTGP